MLGFRTPSIMGGGVDPPPPEGLVQPFLGPWTRLRLLTWSYVAIYYWVALAITTTGIHVRYVSKMSMKLRQI